MAKRFLKNRFKQFNTDGNLWAACYIPNENGKFLVGGIQRDRLQCFYTRNRSLFLFFLGLVFILFSKWISGVFDPFKGIKLGLRSKILLFFFLTSVIPLCSVWKFGYDCMRDSERLSRGRWEERMLAILGTMDASYMKFQNEHKRNFENLEKKLAEDLLRNHDPFQLKTVMKKHFGDIPPADILLLDSFGGETRLTKGDEHAETLGDKAEYPNVLKKYFARIISMEGRIPPKIFSDAVTLLSDKSLDKLIINLDKSFRGWKKPQGGSRNRIARGAFLQSPSEPGRTLGVISYIFWEEDFATPFVKRWITPTQSHIQLMGVSDSGEVFASTATPELPVSFHHMVNRVRIFKTREVDVLQIAGKPTLVMVFPPKNLGGFRLVGMVDAQRIQEDGRFIKTLMNFTTWGSLLYLVLAAMFLSKRFLSRVEKLHDFVNRIIAEKYDSRVIIEGGDELSKVSLTFNEMAQGLERRERLRRFVSDHVWDETLKADEQSLALGGSRRDAAVLFSHIHDFERLSDTLPAEELLRLLNAYFTGMDHAIRQHGGVIDKLIGDAVMAVFFPVQGASHPAVRASLAAKAMIGETLAFNEERREAGKEVVRTDVGIHFGSVISGKVGAKTGRLDFTVIGDVVNTASRLVGTAANLPEDSVVVSETTFQNLPETFSARLLSEVRLKGKIQALKVYLLIEIPL